MTDQLPGDTPNLASSLTPNAAPSATTSLVSDGMPNTTANAIPNVVVKGLDVIYNQGKPNEVMSLDGINLEIFPQEYVIIFGPSGCGKSTLLYSIAGLQKPTNGSVMVDQEDISRYSKKKIAWFHRQKIGMIFQSFYLIGSLSILENVCLPKIFAGKTVRDIKADAITLLKRYNILNQANKFPSELSGGQKQRVAAIRSLINNPEIILADEPVGNLDSKSAHIVMTIFKELNEIDKKTIILVTHDPAHLKYGDKIVHMVDGKIVKIEFKTKEEPQAESYIFRDGKLREDFIKSEFMPPELRLLTQSFQGLSADKIGNLLVPFKAQQIFSHLFFSMTNDQIEKAKKRLESFLYFKDNFHDFFQQLDSPVEEGGAGWDKRLAKRFSDNAKQLVYQSGKIDFANKEKSARELAEYVNSRLELELSEATMTKLTSVIFDRLSNHIGRDEFKRLLDVSEKDKGLNLDKRVVEKISKEIELLLLLRY